MTQNRLLPSVPRQAGRLVIDAQGGLIDPPDYAVVQSPFLTLWSAPIPRADGWVGGAVVTYCRGRRCRITVKACLGHTTHDAVHDAQVGDMFVIGNPARPPRALYELIGRHDWATLRLERRA